MFTAFMARTAAVSVTVYVSCRAGVWGKTEDSDRLLQQITTVIHPVTKLVRRVLPFEQTELSVGQLAREYYNEGVKGTFHIIRNIPNYSGDLAKGAKFTCLELVQKAWVLRQHDGTWLNTSKDNAKLKDAPLDPAAGDGYSQELVVIERPGNIDAFAGDGNVALKRRTK
ncbi:MICOS complex subunit MIC13 homolog QIL1 [Drosophila gunungcola]|uniref:MICOS complex subunit MIC13 n=1 Tax=Drosophila gunungcola TaxID=103775 RepID=A0A9Q0BK06_9MUSC|nr:MICOS complex subunit MIC13 homolog QIL1 [Drosophila gunungcola]KAI8035002.1 hypothetical protein M5D96_012225 [Drosophila gunungcola]